ncbi:hypothetical protein R3P38DRAFT_3189462 [Favolaschia claudopus]|uniref:Uncharacterized protein n=1 Tax=Favolaschia claudopus TaxID=2862362 RepID=A0AAW0BQY1_9AGAR
MPPVRLHFDVEECDLPLLLHDWPKQLQAASENYEHHPLASIYDQLQEQARKRSRYSPISPRTPRRAPNSARSDVQRSRRVLTPLQRREENLDPSSPQLTSGGGNTPLTSGA